MTYVFISSPPIFSVMFCSMTVYVTAEQLISINLCVCLRRGELQTIQRSVCRNQKCRTVITRGGVLVHYNIITGTWHLSSLSSACSRLPYKCTVLSGCPDARQAPVCWMPRWFRSKDTHSSISPARPGPAGETQAAHNPYCSVN